MENKQQETAKKVIIITGGNRGIGYGLAERFLKNNNFKDNQIIITSRDLNLGKIAVEKLLSEFPSAAGHLSTIELDVSDQESISNFKQEIISKFKKIDILFNNAGINPKDHGNDNATRAEYIKNIFNTNLFGQINLILSLLELFAEDAHIINVAPLPRIAKLENTKKAEALHNAKDLNELNKMYEEYEQAYINNTVAEDGWLDSFLKGSFGGYPQSKLFLNAATKILAKTFKSQHTKLKVNAASPGWCRTDMGGNEAPKSYYEGGETLYWLAFNAEEQTGKYFDEMKEVDFY